MPSLAYSDVYSDRYSYIYSDRYSYSYIYSNSYGNVYAYSYVYAYGDIYADIYSDIYADSYSYIYAYAYSHIYAYAYANSDHDSVALCSGQLHASVSIPEWEPAHEYRVQRVGGAARLQNVGGCQLHAPDAAGLLQ